VRGEDDDTVFFTRIADHVVAHSLHADRSVGGELVDNQVALGGFGAKMVLDKNLDGQMTRGTVKALGCDEEELLSERINGLTADHGAGGGFLGSDSKGSERESEQHGQPDARFLKHSAASVPVTVGRCFQEMLRRTLFSSPKGPFTGLARSFQKVSFRESNRGDEETDSSWHRAESGSSR